MSPSMSTTLVFLLILPLFLRGNYIAPYRKWWDMYLFFLTIYQHILQRLHYSDIWRFSSFILSLFFFFLLPLPNLYLFLPSSLPSFPVFLVAEEWLDGWIFVLCLVFAAALNSLPPTSFDIFARLSRGWISRKSSAGSTGPTPVTVLGITKSRFPPDSP